jgi:hypothetical protein
MWNWFRRKKLSVDARRRLTILAARSEEAVVETHVANATALLGELADEVDLERGLDLYEEIMHLPPILSATVRTRVMARVGAGTPRPAPRPAPPQPRARSRHLEI